VNYKTAILAIIVAFLVGASIFLNIGYFVGQDKGKESNDLHYKQGFKDALEWKLKAMQENSIGG